MYKTEVLMATYNGEKFIEQQLRSILLNENIENILIHDDGSRDKTPEIIRDLSKEDSRIKILEHPPVGSAKNNFLLLMNNSNAEYVFFSDQDDVWFSDKSDRMLELIKVQEKIYGKEFPIIIHTDLELINEDNELISNSFWNYQNLNPDWGNKINLIATQNVVTGCSMLINRAALIRSLSMPKEAIMHDWWIAMVVCENGKILYSSDKTVKYRQHRNNEVGAKKFNLEYIYYRLRRINEIREDSMKISIQAGAFIKLFPNCKNSSVLRDLSMLPRIGRAKRVKSIIKNRFYKMGVIRNIGWLFL